MDVQLSRSSTGRPERPPASALAAERQPRVVAITGARTYLGAELIRSLEEDPACERVLALDIQPPPLGTSGKVEFVKLDLTQATVDSELATILRSAQVDTVVHGAFLSHPTHRTEWAHELEDVGTMHVLNACAAVPPARIVAVSSTAVYGAHPQNPNFLTEAAELRGHKDSRYINDRVRVEKQLATFARERPAVEVSSLRFAPILGPSVSNMHTRFFARAVAPVMMGHDPVMQFIHEQDAAWALQKAVRSQARGAFNIVGKGVLPYSTILAMLGRVPVVLPYLAARQLAKAMWTTQITGSPPSFLEFLMYPCIGDGERAKRVLGFSPLLSIRRTLWDFLGIMPQDGATDIARSLG